MTAIQTQDGHIALVDDADVKCVCDYEWRSIRPRNTWYAVTYPVDAVPVPMLYMHRLILDAPPGTTVDHIDGNGLNNRRDNLREASHSQQAANSQRHYDKQHSRYKGVFFQNATGKWYVRLMVRGHFFYGGQLFTNEIEAAAMYDGLARKHFGEYARTNL